MRALVFTGTAADDPEGASHVERFFTQLASEERLESSVTSDPEAFTERQLSRFDAAVFAHTSGDVLNDEQQTALERFVAAGGGFVAVDAADAEADWPWYRTVVGPASFAGTMRPTSPSVRVKQPQHQSVAHLPESFSLPKERHDSGYRAPAGASLLLAVDGIPAEATVDASAGSSGPLAWHLELGAGRALHTGLGRHPDTWTDPRFQTHLLEAIRWAAGGGYYARSVLTQALGNPLGLALTPQGDAYVIERTGTVLLWSSRSGRLTQALELPVDTGYENGLLGIVLDPHFSTNRHVYLYHSRPRGTESAVAAPGSNALVRYSASDDGTLEPTSARVLLEVPSERRCCHEGGALAFAFDGTLLLSTGDNTNPFESEGAAPIDGRVGREAYDARRTAANPFDLRGKVLRINADGSIPEGNLFPSNGSQGRPEVYVMGVRNPFRLAADPQRPGFFFGDVGPDAVTDGARGPRGYDEINWVDRPGDYGWPFCIGDNRPYHAYDFTEGRALEPFDCGDRHAALLEYDYTSATHRALGSGVLPDGTLVGRTAIAGAVYRAAVSARHRFPARLDGQLLMADWTRDIVASIAVDPGGELRGVERLFGTVDFRRPIDIEVGPDGAIHILEYGSDFWGDNPDARLTRLEYGAPADLSPTARIAAEPTHGAAPLRVRFSAAESQAPPRQHLTEYAWDFDGDGVPDARGESAEHTFTQNGEYHVGLIVTSSAGQQSLPVTTRLIVGNAPPRVRILEPQPGSRLAFGSAVRLLGEAVDPEDGVARCADLQWHVGLIHDQHSHPYLTLAGCDASFTPRATDHEATAPDLSFSIELVYTDRGGPKGEPPQTARQGIQLELVGP